MSDESTTSTLLLTSLRSAGDNSFFDPYQGLIDDQERAEQLKNLRYGFRIGPYNLLMGTKTLCEVVQNAAIYGVPNTANWVSGMMNLRGNLVPVFDIKQQLPDAGDDIENRCLLILDQNENAAGMYIDGLPVALEIDVSNSEHQTDIPSDLPAILRTHVSTAYISNDSVWLEIDHHALFEALLREAGSLDDSGLRTNTFGLHTVSS
ncbi:MAG: chemotaxis protein CheW [Gammaproteobacteria bacterium]